MDFPFPLLEPRQEDRHYYDTASSLNHYSLDIPEARGGRVRLQLTIPWYDLDPEKGAQVLTLAIVWPKHGPALPGPKEVAEEIWKRLTTVDFERTRRSSRPLFWPKLGPPRTQPSDLVMAHIRFKKWRAEVIIRKEDQDLAKSLPRDNANVCLITGLGWAFRFFHGRWSRDKDKVAWVYRAHRNTALIVAEEVAELYLSKSSHLFPRQHLDGAYPRLAERIKEAYSHPTVTARRLALALVDIKFEKLLNKLLDPNRPVGLDDATLWSRLLPPENRKRLLELCPASSVWEIMSWAEARREENEAASGFSSWYICLVHKPLAPLNPPFDTDIRKRSEIAFLEFPGVERWASIVWEALNS